MRRIALRLAVLAAAAALLTTPHPTIPQATTDHVAARTLLATNLTDAILNPAKGEDTEFFLRGGGVPNIFFLIDTSGSMERLPPDGPASYGGLTAAVPPGVQLDEEDRGDTTITTNVRNSRTILGCGLDPVSSTNPAFVGNVKLQAVQNRKFSPPCGTAHDPALVGATYGGDTVDYAYQASICPYYTAADSQAVWPTNRGGYDPDYYMESPNDTQKTSVLWVKDLVYHDNEYDIHTYGRSTSSAFKHNFGKGWVASSPPRTYPARNSAGGFATIDQFCNEQGTTALANGQVPSDVCKQCLKTAGWYYDGINYNGYVGWGEQKPYPSIWYTGNYLNFFPPKFLVVRKIVKDLVASQSKVRMAMAQFGSNGMALMKEFNPTCAHPESNFDSNRTTYVNLLDALDFNGGTPVSLALFDVGRYYHSPGLPWFGGTWEKTGTSWESSSNSNDYAICYSCQTSSVVVLTDGVPSPGDGNTSSPALPSGPASLQGTTGAESGTYAGATTTGIRGVSTTDCPQCGAFSGSLDYLNNLSRVAWYLNKYDLRNNTEATKDCMKNGGRQTLDVYTVGYATRDLANANTVLANAAAAGGGLFVGAESAEVLREGLTSVFEEINNRSTSFSVATVSALQTTSGHSVVVPRFDPAKAAAWKGHLYRYELWSEFVQECSGEGDAANCCHPGGSGDYDCDGECLSVYLMDSGAIGSAEPSLSTPWNGKFIQEGGDGFFYRNEPDLAACTQTPVCVAASSPCGDVGSAAARPWWDAGEALRQTSWKRRKVFTVVDSNLDGRIDASDGNTELTTGTDVAAQAILPYLGNKGGRVCNIIANRIETAGDAATATVVRTDEIACAKSVIRWLLGGDVFNEAGRKATDSPPWPPPRPNMSSPATPGDPSTVPPIPANLPDQEQLPDRPFKLGDVFHSSPVVVDAPSPSSSVLCNMGLQNQCLRGLWMAGKGEQPSAEAAYDGYASHYAHRRKLVLVGANDGLVHAFNGGEWHANEDDLTTPLDEREYGGYYDRGTSSSVWAEEAWAFLPPDMIGKLSLMFDGEHQLFVDGTAMVRDVWVDGTGNDVAAATPWDDVKQAQEFHTVAIFGERRGGTHYFALDLSDATVLPSESGHTFPTFLWIYPQPTDPRTLTQGETYNDFMPKPPPIGPVRIEADVRSGEAKTATPRHEGIPYHERWVAFLSGGYDQQLVRGRGVHMVDAWTGREYFDFSYPYDGTDVQSDDPRWHLRYPVPATVGMVQWGPGPRRENGLGMANNLYFDLATFGDAGGQLWLVRFHDPGKLGASGRVENWFGGRVYQMGGRVAESLGYAHPFFYITSNTAMPNEYTYRVYAGTGDRYNLLDTNGGICGPDNLRACAQRGCTINVDVSGNYVSTPELGKTMGSQYEVGRGDLSTSGGTAAGTAGQITSQARVTVSACPSPSPNTGPTGFTKNVLVTCTPDAQGRWGCVPTQADYGENVILSDTSNAPVTRNWFHSLKVFDDVGDRAPFSTYEQAVAYDAARYWIRDAGGTSITQVGGIAIMAASVENPATSATATSPGWAIYFDHGAATGTVVADGHVYPVSPLDERTSSVSAIGGSVVTWSSTQPALAAATSAGSCFASKCTAEDRRVSYHYGAHPMTGGSVLTNLAGATVRANVSNTLVPAQADQSTVFVNRKGQVQVGLTVVNPEKGAASVPGSEATEAAKELGWIEISKETHACRHEGRCR